jgi:hypothetical protein
MRFISIYTHPSDPKHPAGPNPELVVKMTKLVEDGMKEGWLIATEGVHSGHNGLIVKSTKGKVSVVDGPFAEAKEVLGGYAILEAPSREAVIELSRRFLAVAGDGTCEVHQIYTA